MTLAVNGGRINIGACSLGGAAFCLDAAQEHAAVRKQFGQAIGSFQAMQFKLADMATSLHSARLMVRYKLRLPRGARAQVQPVFMML